MPKVLVIAEHADGRLKNLTRSAAAFAGKLCPESPGDFVVLAIGSGIDAAAAEATWLGGVETWTIDSPALFEPLADRYAGAIAFAARKAQAQFVVAGVSTFSKDILPRAAALLDAGMIADVVDVKMADGDFLFRRPMYAGNVFAEVRLAGAVRCVTVRAAAFPAEDPVATPNPIVRIEVPENEMSGTMRFVGRDAKSGGRPDPTEARIVVSGGRALRNAEEFERIVGGLADALGGAVGASRALVDSGIAPNSLQVGQTGKTVAPDLYIALGISGAIQHVAGMKEARTIVAINKDADAPIFDVADYGLVADVHSVVPELIARIKAGKSV